MPPTLEPQSSVPPPLAPAPKTTRWIVWFFIGLVLAVLLISGGVFVWKSGLLPAVPPQENPTTSLDQSKWIFPEWNFALTKNPAWTLLTETDLRAVTFPTNVTNVVFALQKGQCVFVFRGPDEGQFASTFTYLGVPTLIPPLPSGTKFSVGYVLEESLQPSGFKYNPNTEQHFPGEMLVTDVSDRSIIRRLSYGDPYFILFDNKGGLVDKGCATETSAMISTLIPQYDTAILNNESYGALYLKNGKLLFVDDKNTPQDTRETLISGTSSTAFIPVPLVYKNKIFYATDTSLSEFDPFTNKTISFPIPSIADLFPVGNELYAVGDGKSDTGVSADWHYTLFSLSLLTGSTTTLGTVREGVISGYSSQQDALYFVEGSEGMGCSSGSYSRFLIKKKVFESLGKIEYCRGEAGYESAKARENAITTAIDTRNDGDSFALIKNGQIIKASADEEKKWQSMIEWQSSAWDFASSTLKF